MKNNARGISDRPIEQFVDSCFQLVDLLSTGEADQSLKVRAPLAAIPPPSTRAIMPRKIGRKQLPATQEPFRQGHRKYGIYDVANVVVLSADSARRMLYQPVRCERARVGYCGDQVLDFLCLENLRRTGSPCVQNV